MQVIDKKDNFFSIGMKEGEKLVIADGNGKIVLSLVVSEDCILNTYRKVDFSPLTYQE